MAMRALRAALWASVLLLTTGALACRPACADGTSGRVDVPISQVVLPDGNIRYSVPVSIGGGAPIAASLDTGSFGLRVLARALNASQYEATDMQRRYGFGGGARFNGVLAKSKIAVGDARTGAPILFQLIQSVDCMPQKPKCPAARVDATDYRIAGDGYAGLGFDAIIGISMRSARGGESAHNPLATIGDGRWIVLLPRPGQAAPGHLIINPTTAETAGFSLFHLAPQPSNEGNDGGSSGWKDASLSGCVVNQTSKQRLCGQTLFDTGAPGIAITSSQVPGPSTWPQGTPGTLELQGGDQPVTMPFSVGPNVATRVHLSPSGDTGGDRLSVGSLPYFSYAVLYDQKNGLLGVKLRDGS